MSKAATFKEIASYCGLSAKDIESIYDMISQRHIYLDEHIIEEMKWFFVEIGINDYYFKTTPVEVIADHLDCMVSAKRIGAKTKDGIDLNIESDPTSGKVFLVSDIHRKAIKVEERILRMYPVARIESYRSKRPFYGDVNLRMYFITLPEIKEIPEKPGFDDLVTEDFITHSPKETYKRYKAFWKEARTNREPSVRVSDKKETQETRIMVYLPNEYNENFFSKISNVFDSYGITSNRKYMEPMGNDITMFSFYLPEITDTRVLEDLQEDVVLASIMPDNQIEEHFAEGVFNAKETFYAMVASEFVHQFLSTLDVEYQALVAKMQGDAELLELARKFRTTLAKDTFTMNRIETACLKHPNIIKELYLHFKQRFYETTKDYNKADHEVQIENLINHEVRISHDRDILRMMMRFNNHILKTNFYKDHKSSVSFRLDPGFMNENDYVELPFGVVYIYGKEFFGFHVRFRDIARGGIRIVRSRDFEAFVTNSDFILEENYGLAYTQQRKNKDIPEGGSKGTILLRSGAQDKADFAFRHYVDGILDLLLPDKDTIDYYGQEELLFLGPDEGTAHLMEWASLRAKERGYRFWKAFTTGKPPKIGGIPHDDFGMTTQSVHQNVLGILDRLGIKEEDITKFQTGGPDGDLGSNEILISKDRTIGIVDGSGVVYDPLGLDRKELTRLAKKRVMIQEFDTTKLSKDGFRVLISDNNMRLPDGTVVASGLDFRNLFHLSPYAKADLLSPNGGRPKAINMSNVKELLDENGSVKFRFIVEGANLFVTQEARLWLERRGVIVIKDATANKGGVTSSSLEVLASLALEDEEFLDLICKMNRKEPEFRINYVEDVQRIIRTNAEREFNVLYNANQETGKLFTHLSDELSNKINLLTDRIAESDLFSDKVLLKKVLKNYVPATLQNQIGIATLMDRVPAMYQRAIMATELARSYVYEYGLQATEVDFLAYITNYK